MEMEAITLDLSQRVYGTESSPVKADIRFSLRPFIGFLKERISREKTAKVNFYHYLLEQFSAYPELEHGIAAGETEKYKHLFELINTALSPIIADEQEQLWAISMPVLPCFYYGTPGFYTILLDKQESLKQDLSLPSKEEMAKTSLRNFYNIVLKKYYDFTLDNQPFMIKSFIDQKTHLLKYYRINVDNRFLDVQSKDALPELTLQHINEHAHDDAMSTDMLMQVLPPENFIIEGIAIITLTDVTAEYALESIKTTIIEHNQCKEEWTNATISAALKSLVDTDAIDFGLLPYITLNDKTLLYSHEGFESIVVHQAKVSGMDEQDYTLLADSFVEHPRRLFFPEIKALDIAQYPTLKLISDSGVKAYALFPLFYSGKLVGCLEMYTRDKDSFNSNTLSRIEAAFPLLAQLYQNIITDFNNEIMTIVTDQFTGLQSAVKWRFYQAAYDYMLSGDWAKNLPIDTVYFKDVHPFYGAIDIKNSSIERNLMIRKDLYAHFEVLGTLLKNLEGVLPATLAEVFPKYTSWKKMHFEDMSDRDIMRTDDYLQRQLPPYLEELQQKNPAAAELIAEYMELTKSGGKIFENRDNYELSMQMINHALNRQLDEFNAELQEVYPCYFEKFRTDGVEFDIYLGQSISPDRKYTPELLADFRFRQLKVIAEIAQTTENLTSHLPIPLQTTQLVFVYGKLLDISFRIDEQRFDVEGGYNIRYQMVKKRIDKAHVKDSTERLTQPGKIAVIYFSNEEGEEYKGYIRRLQDEGLLTSSVEYLDVEELQGVEGLKALRVEVIVNKNLNE